jgi:hypothetical protein
LEPPRQMSKRRGMERPLSGRPPGDRRGGRRLRARRAEGGKTAGTSRAGKLSGHGSAFNNLE